MSGPIDRVVRPARCIRGRVRVPGDKSISHRALILGALATGRTRVRGLAPGDDCQATRHCLSALGVSIGTSDGGHQLDAEIDGLGLGGLRAPGGALDARNSGTTARVLMGVLAGHAFRATLTGDGSLQRRPMRRVAEPLALMGARITTTDGRLPATVEGGHLRAIAYAMPVPSAQVKTAILLAGLHAAGTTTVTEPAPTRDHTERALAAFGLPVKIDAAGIRVTGGGPLRAADISVPGDPSAAAFWAAAAAALPGSAVEILDVGLNPTRTAFLGVLQRVGAQVVIDVTDARALEPVGHLTIRHAGVGAVVIAPDDVPGLVDELPALAALATHGGSLSVSGAQELRLKESDRIAALVAGLRQLGADVEEFPDGFAVYGARQLSGGVADAAGDHRLAMAFAIAALGARDASVIRGADVVSVSYPGFFEVLEGLCG
jgi:3-phosphoshikimate 1-carboxyvinyltransferase